jgi:general stress protein 26
MTHLEDTRNDRQLLAEKIKGVRVAMMTTLEADNSLRSRPMATQEMEFEDNLWFLTLADAPKVSEVAQHQQVNLSYVKPEDNLFVSVSGTAQLVRDRQKIKEMWKPFYKAWFPNGEDDPNLALLKVHVEHAEYWDAPSGKMGLLYSVVKGLATGGKDPGENKKLDIN